MLALLDETDQRRIKLLEVLARQPGWIIIGELALLVHASERTVHSDLAYLKNRWEGQLQIEVSLKNGVRLGCHHAATLHEIQIDIFKSAVAPRFLRNLFFFPHQTIEFYTKKLFISKSTLVRLIPKINATLATTTVSIERRGLCYSLFTPDEQELRKLLATMYLELNPPLAELPDVSVEWLVPGAKKPMNFSRLHAIVSDMLLLSPNREAVELVLKNSLAVPQMVAFYFVSLIREYQGFHVASDYALRSEITEQDLIYILERFPTLTRENLQPIHALLMKPFLTSDNEAEEALLDAQAHAYFTRVFVALHVSCPDEIRRQLVQTMKILYHYALIYPIYSTGFFMRINGFITSLQESHPKLYDAFSESLVAFNRAMQIDLTTSMPELILHACFLFPALGMASPPRRVFIVSDSGIEHASFIANFVRSYLNGAYYETVQVAPVSYASAIDPAFGSQLATDDIFVATAPNLMHLAPECQSILFHDFPSVENLCDLYNTIYRK